METGELIIVDHTCMVCGKKHHRSVCGCGSSSYRINMARIRSTGHTPRANSGEQLELFCIAPNAELSGSERLGIKNAKHAQTEAVQRTYVSVLERLVRHFSVYFETIAS